MSDAATPVTRSYRPGDWFGIFGAHATVILPPSEKSRVPALWSLVDEGAGFDEVLDALIAGGLRELPGFVLVAVVDDATKVVIRGAARAVFTCGGASVEVEGSSGSTWVERSLTGVTAMTVTVAEAGEVDHTIDGGLARIARIDEPPYQREEPEQAPEAAATPEQPEPPEPPIEAPAVTGSHRLEPAASFDSGLGIFVAHDPDDQVAAEPEEPEEAVAAPAVDELPTEPFTPLADESVGDSPAEDAGWFGSAPEQPAPPAWGEPLPEDQQAAAPPWGEPVEPTIPPVQAPAPVVPSWPPVAAPEQEHDERSDAPGWPPSPPGNPEDAPVTGAEHDGLTQANPWDPAEFQRPQPGIPGQPPAPSVTSRPVALLMFSTGEEVPVDRAILVGRSPEARRFTSTDQPRLVTVPSPNQEISSTHLEVRPGSGADHGMAVVTDLGSTNGTLLVQPGLPPEDLTAGIAVQLIPGAIIDLGEGVTIQVTHA